MSDNTEPRAETTPPAPLALPPPGREPPDKYAPRMPDAVRRAAARAEELQAEQAAQQNAEAEQQRQEVEQSVPSQSPAPPPVPSEEVGWERRYRTLQGKYDAELPPLRAQVANLEHLIATMQAAPPPAAPVAPAAPAPPEVTIPEEDYAAYGADFVDSSRRWAGAEAEARIAPVARELKEQIADLRRRDEQDRAERIKQDVKAQLNSDPELLGRWEQIDRSRDFWEWLQEPDEFSGERRMSMFHRAYLQGDAVRTGRFFKAFLREHTEAAPYAPGPAPQTPPNGNGHYGAGVDLAAYASPGRVSNATPGIGAQTQRIWSNREIAAFYAERLRGRFRGREAEADALDRDIVAAGREGRIRNV